MSKTRLDIIRKIVEDPFDEVNSVAMRYLIDLVDQAGDWMTRSKALAGGADHDRGKSDCDYGLWFRPDGKLDGDEGTEVDTREQCKECTCGYNDLLRALGKEVE